MRLDPSKALLSSLLVLCLILVKLSSSIQGMLLWRKKSVQRALPIYSRSVFNAVVAAVELCQTCYIPRVPRQRGGRSLVLLSRSMNYAIVHVENATNRLKIYISGDCNNANQYKLLLYYIVPAACNISHLLFVTSKTIFKVPMKNASEMDGLPVTFVSGGV